MGNIMKSQMKFSNLTFPKMKPTKLPILMENKINANKSVKFYIDKELNGDKKNNFPIYHFGTKSKFNAQEYGVYQLPDAISVLTYNIWFQQHNSKNRFQCILKLLELSNADFICLQEVTHEFTNLLHSLSTKGWIGNYYIPVVPMGWYDTIILSKFKCKFYKIPFEGSFMGRNMVFAELIEAEGRNVIVGCMHYQSLQGNEKIRQDQIQSVQKITNQCERVMIVGDYNLSDGFQQNNVIDKKFTDLWVKLHKQQQNRHTMPKTTKFSAWRPDHVLCKVPENVSLKQAEIYKFGDFTIPPFQTEQYAKITIDNVVRTPSDHFGLISWIPIQ